MSVDLIISEAFQNSTPGEGLFIVEGHPQRNEFRILPADEAFKMNLNAFAWNINTGYQYMGIFTEEKLAHEYIDKVRQLIRDEQGNRLIN